MANSILYMTVQLPDRVKGFSKNGFWPFLSDWCYWVSLSLCVWIACAYSFSDAFGTVKNFFAGETTSAAAFEARTAPHMKQNLQQLLEEMSASERLLLDTFLVRLPLHSRHSPILCGS